MTLGVRKMKLLGVAAAAILALGASGCSSLPTVPDWVDPTNWFGGDDAGADNAPTPDLAGLPDKPAAQTPDEQQQVAESLAADRANAKYSAEALRGGNEPAAAPPADAAPNTAADEPVVALKPRDGAPVAAPVRTATVDRSMAQDPTGNTAPGTLPATQPGAPVAVAETPAAAEPVKTAEAPEAAPPVKTKKSKPVRVAEVAPVTPAQPPVAVAQVTPASVSPSDAELGFKPSSAPPLDASVSQFVASPIIDHYRSTAANAGMAMASNAPATATAPRRHRAHRAVKPAVAMGGPEHMEGKVVANLDVLGSSAAAAEPQPVFANVSGAAAVVYFPHDSVGVTAVGRAQVRAAVEQFKAGGSQGYIKVIGHASSRTANMSAEAHLALIFKKSQDRANAVAREIIRAGVPADHVLVEAVGDTQPVYYESMPKGEDGNRRAEIFIGG